MKKFKKVYKNIINFFSDDTRKIKRNDLIIIGILVLIYSIIAFTNLGSTKAPQNYFYFANDGYEATVELTKGKTEISKIRHYSGNETGSYKLYSSNDGKTYKEVGSFSDDSVFNWKDDSVNQTFKYLKIVAVEGNSYIGEIRLYDKYGNKVEVKASNENSKAIVDEQDTVPGMISYLNSAYFDEIYFARSAYEYVHDIPTMEWVHPPLGKLIQAIPILFMGMTPFAWRLMGCLAGILMIPVMYIFAKNIFKKRKYALLAAILMMFDGMHFVQTRIGTVDSFLVLFTMISALFMFKYLLLDKYDSIKPKLKYLGLSGLFFGLATCVKWTGMYLGLGLAIIFFGKLIYDIYKDKKISKQYLKIIPFCILFFVIIPVIIYILSYILFPNVMPGNVNTIQAIINQIKQMYEYHSTLTATHEFSSPWYSWLIMYKPVWYYVGTYGINLKSTIVAIGNPAIWWLGIISILYLIVSAVKNKRKGNTFILVMILSIWLPYVFIGRCMFMYHFFPVLPFIMLANVSLIKWITGKIKNNYIYIIYLLLVILFFIYFYPVISGRVVTSTFVDTLRWFSNWIF